MKKHPNKITLGTCRKERRNRKDGGWDFKEAVKSPQRWVSHIERVTKAIERDSRAASRWSDAQLSEAVHRFIFDVPTAREASGEASVLKSLGSRVSLPVLQILGNTSLHSRLVAPTGENLGPEAPFNRACQLLDDSPSEHSVPLLDPFLKQSAAGIRKDAALVLGSIGTLAAVPPLKKALGDADEYVRGYALIGLKRAMMKQRLDRRCVHGLYQSIARLIVAGQNCDDACAILLDMDRLRAKRLLLSPVVFAPGSTALHHALRALAARCIAVPRSRLLTLIASLEQSASTRPTSRDRAIGQSLRLLGQLKARADHPFLEVRMNSPEKGIASGAASGLMASLGLERLEESIWEACRRGYRTLNPSQKHYIAVMKLDGEVNNGGWTQYFFNSSGNHWRDAVKGLEAMGSKERLAILRDAVATFGKVGPAANRERRQEQLAKLERRSGSLFRELDDRYYKSQEVVEVLAKKYVLKHTEAFK